MDQFLSGCGLSEAGEVFTKHDITLDMLDDLTPDLMKELLPSVGHRICLMRGIKQLKSSSMTKKTKPKRLQRNKTNISVKKVKQGQNVRLFTRIDPDHQKEIIAVLQTDYQLIAELYELGTNALIETSLFSFEDGCRRASSEWKLINFVKGSLTCPLCMKPIFPNLRKGAGAKLSWKISNFKRHLIAQHFKGDDDDEEASDNNDRDKSINVSNRDETTDDEFEVNAFLKVDMVEGTEDVAMEISEASEIVAEHEAIPPNVAKVPIEFVGMESSAEKEVGDSRPNSLIVGDVSSALNITEPHMINMKDTGDDQVGTDGATTFNESQSNPTIIVDFSTVNYQSTGVAQKLDSNKKQMQPDIEIGNEKGGQGGVVNEIEIVESEAWSDSVTGSMTALTMKLPEHESSAEKQIIEIINRETGPNSLIVGDISTALNTTEPHLIYADDNSDDQVGTDGATAVIESQSNPTIIKDVSSVNYQTIDVAQMLDSDEKQMQTAIQIGNEKGGQGVVVANSMTALTMKLPECESSVEKEINDTINRETGLNSLIVCGDQVGTDGATEVIESQSNPSVIEDLSTVNYQSMDVAQMLDSDEKQMQPDIEIGNEKGGQGGVVNEIEIVESEVWSDSVTGSMTALTMKLPEHESSAEKQIIETINRETGPNSLIVGDISTALNTTEPHVIHTDDNSDDQVGTDGATAVIESQSNASIIEDVSTVNYQLMDVAQMLDSDEKQMQPDIEIGNENGGNGAVAGSINALTMNLPERESSAAKETSETINRETGPNSLIVGDISTALNTAEPQMIHIDDNSDDQVGTDESVSSDGLATEVTDEERPEWQKRDVKFGWVRFNKDPTYYPGFIFRDGMCRYITTKSELSNRKLKVSEYHQTLEESKKWQRKNIC